MNPSDEQHDHETDRPAPDPSAGNRTGSDPADADRFDGDGPDVDRPAPDRPPANPPAPDRLCRRCSTVSSTTGDFCPHCGASYVRRRRLPLPALRRRTKLVLAAVLAVLLVAGIGTGVVLQQQAEERTERRERARANLRELEQRRERRRAVAAAASAAAEEEAASAEEELQRTFRTSSVRELRRSVTKDAQEKQEQGLLEDRATSTSCENTDGNEDDLAEDSAAYSCIAVTEKSADGGSRGYEYSARIDFEDGSYTWELGD